MSVINVTPDSFSDTDHLLTPEAVLQAAQRHIAEGADILDIGGCSTRPGSAQPFPEEEQARVVMAVRTIRSQFSDIPLSVDTYRASVAEAAIQAGANIINDISGGQLDDDMFATAARLRTPYILTHTRGTPEQMQHLTQYDHLMSDMLRYFQEKVAQLRQLGVRDIILDPGFGFAKTLEQNYQLLSHLPELQELGLPILAGISRKSMIYKLLGITPQEAQNGTTALHMVCLEKGASILRVHDTKAAREVVALHKALVAQSGK